MIPEKRQKQILAWVKQHGSVRIAFLKEELGVSEMTIYRDIQKLIQDEEIERVPGGVKYLQPSVQSRQCGVCFQESFSVQAAQLMHADGSMAHFCCPHCLLMFMAHHGSEEEQVIGRDFLRGTTMNARLGIFLIGADECLHCCAPQVLLFQHQAQAVKFQAGFGGELYDFSQAVTAVASAMSCCTPDPGQN
ncbi:DeoR family transcriptional regulator [Marinococcus halophilus]|uniref:HTH-type transcriptional repressor YcnK n=1 Tax=Marinococcus halophilus TaxID=1371 RepID=A0A510Y8Y1_MARHA|nr:DeoR family transcriptional regulator [Marinococcus halophilus]GEK59836.1 HTH-type transcriptional repressor YcnK [Marinococcus halophilus]